LKEKKHDLDKSFPFFFHCKKTLKKKGISIRLNYLEIKKILFIYTFFTDSFEDRLLKPFWLKLFG